MFINILTKLEKSKSFWFLLIITLVFFFLRLPSLIEPNWYGDEGIYQVIGMAIDHGRMLYSGAWDNKPPLLYLTYALFNGDQFGVRILALMTGLVSTWLFYFLAQKLFKKHWVNVTATTLFAVLFAIPLLEGNIANAENFMLLPIIAAGLIITSLRGRTEGRPPANEVRQGREELKKQSHSRDRHALWARDDVWIFAAGLLLGLAFLFKIVAVFDFAAFFVFIFFLNWPLHKNKETRHWQVEIEKVKALIHDSLFMILGFVLPLILTISYFAVNNALPTFFQASFLGNVGYVGYGNTFFIPQGLLILKTSLLAIFVLVLFWRKKHIETSTQFVLLWTAFSLFDALFSQRPYTHYVLVFLPAFCLLVGLVLEQKTTKKKSVATSILLASLIIMLSNFNLYSFKKSFLYYQNAFLFITNQKNVTSYQSFFDRKTPRDYQVAAFLTLHTKPYEPVFIWGDNSQIYALSHTLPINKYTVAYHVTQNKTGIQETQHALDTVRPKYVIILAESPTFPFILHNYTSTYSIQGAAIYEKDF